MVKEKMQRRTKNTCRGCQCRMSSQRCPGCSMICPDCYFDRGQCFNCVRSQFADACRFRVRSTGAILPFQHLRTIAGTVGRATPENTEVVTVDHSQGYREFAYRYLDVEIVPPVPLPDLPKWVYHDHSVSPNSVRLDYNGKSYQVQQQHGILYAYEGGFLEATRGYSSLVVAYADSLDALKSSIDYWTGMYARFGPDARTICCDQAELTNCVCRLSYKCRIHHPQGVHHGTHD